MAGAEELQQQLQLAQNADGGWGYDSSNSWTEPTALAMLALRAHAEMPLQVWQRASAWLLRSQRRDGGWPPRPGIDQSTWVTSLATLALPETNSQQNASRAIDWITSHLDKGPTYLMRAIARWRNIPETTSQLGGSSWFPGTAAWVAPTVCAILALSDHATRTSNDALLSHVEEGQRYLWSRRCADHGWNHGGSSFRSENAGSYPEMTGMALIALSSDPVAWQSVLQLEDSLGLAQSFLANPESIEGLSWLQLGLLRHGRNFSDVKTNLPCRTTRDISLRLLALSAASPTNKLLIPLRKPYANS